MAANYSIYPPLCVAITQSDTVDTLNLRGIDIYADGDLHWESPNGETFTETFTVTTGPTPYRFVAMIKRIYATGTTIADGNMVGLE